MTGVDIRPTALRGVVTLSPRRLADDRGAFWESVRLGELHDERGTAIPFVPRQINYSVSRRDTVRGLHAVASPPGQAKLVTCVRGAVRDIVVDLRRGSPTFGRHCVTELAAGSGISVLVPDGAAHGFRAATDDACVCYVLSHEHVPGTQVDIDPLDPALALPWGCDGRPVLSPKDASAPPAAEVVAAGLLAPYSDPSPEPPEVHRVR